MPYPSYHTWPIQPLPTPPRRSSLGFRTGLAKARRSWIHPLYRNCQVGGEKAVEGLVPKGTPNSPSEFKDAMRDLTRDHLSRLPSCSTAEGQVTAMQLRDSSRNGQMPRLTIMQDAEAPFAQSDQVTLKMMETTPSVLKPPFSNKKARCSSYQALHPYCLATHQCADQEIQETWSMGLEIESYRSKIHVAPPIAPQEIALHLEKRGPRYLQFPPQKASVRNQSSRYPPVLCQLSAKAQTQGAGTQSASLGLANLSPLRSKGQSKDKRFFKSCLPALLEYGRNSSTTSTPNVTSQHETLWTTTSTPIHRASSDPAPSTPRATLLPMQQPTQELPYLAATTSIEADILKLLDVRLSTYFDSLSFSEICVHDTESRSSSKISETVTRGNPMQNYDDGAGAWLGFARYGSASPSEILGRDESQGHLLRSLDLGQPFEVDLDEITGVDSDSQRWSACGGDKYGLGIGGMQAWTFH